MTECEKKELIKSIAMGMSFEDVAEIYEMSADDVNAFYKDHKSEIDEERKFQKMKYGG